MPFLMIRDDIVKVRADAVVNPANEELLEGSGTSRAIYLAAGEEKLEKACRRIGCCDPGRAVITRGFGLPAKYVIHAVGPLWMGGDRGEEKLLYSAYRESLMLAKKHHLKSIAFPLLSAGNYHYPKEQALRTAVRAIGDFLMEYEMLVYLVLYDRDAVLISRKLSSSIDEYIDDHYVETKDEHLEGDQGYPDFDKEQTVRWENRWERRFFEPGRRKLPPESEENFTLPYGRQKFPHDDSKMPELFQEAADRDPEISDSQSASVGNEMERTSDDFLPKESDGEINAASFMLEEPHRLSGLSDIQKAPRSLSAGFPKRSLDQLLAHMDETFSQMLLRLIDERGLKDSTVYRKANVDRRHFSKIRNDVNYAPNKKTVLAFAIALELSLDETKDLLMRAGFAFSGSSRFDVIVCFFIENRQYDIFEINEALFAYGQPLLGQV